MSEFEKMKAHARDLPRSELERHASVSINSRHSCRDCFTCACAEVLRESPVISSMKGRSDDAMRIPQRRRK